MNLKDYRTMRKITQWELADELSKVCPGIDRTLVSKIESGIVKPSREVEVYIEDMCAHYLTGSQSHEKPSNGKSIDRVKKVAQIGDFRLMDEMVLEALMGATKSNPLTRDRLRDITKMRDSVAREIIGRLRDQGYRVIGSAGVKGYWIAKSDEEYLAFRAEYHAKAMTYLRRVQAMDSFTEGQTSMYE